MKAQHKKILAQVVNQTASTAKEVANKHLNAHEDDFERFVDEFLATIRKGLLEFYAEVRKFMAKDEPVMVEPRETKTHGNPPGTVQHPPKPHSHKYMDSRG